MCLRYILQLGAYCRVSSVIWFILYFAGKVFLQLGFNMILAVNMKLVLVVGDTSISTLFPQMFLRMLAISTVIVRGTSMSYYSWCCCSYLNVNIVCKTLAVCYKSPKKELTSHVFEYLIYNLKLYNGIEI